MTSYASGTKSVRAPFGRSKVNHSGDGGSGSGNIIINTRSARPDFGANIRVRPSSADDNENSASRQNGTVGSHERVLLARREKANQSSGSGSVTPRSRGRQKGEHEPDPFLSVDSVPEGKATEVMTRAWPERPKKKKMVAVEMLPDGIRSASQRGLKSPGPMNKSTQSLNISREASPDRNFRSPSPTRPTYISPNKEKRANHHIRAPFKHAVNKPPMEPMQPDPAEEMKERTALATYQLSMIIERENTPVQSKPPGHLWKGRLQPLYPVTVEGPSIYQCQGIQPEPRRPYIVGVPSHTVQRRQQIMANYPTLPPYGERPQTVESVHNTSRASSMAENRDQELILQMEGEILIDQPQETYYGDQYDPDQMIVDDELAMDEDIEIAAVTGTPSQVPFDAFRGEQGRDHRPESGGSDKENMEHSEAIIATPSKITPIGPVRCLRQEEYRPQTVPEDGRKSVRFADPPSSYNTTDIKNRSKSAGIVSGVRVRQEVGVLPSVTSPRASTALSMASSASGLHAPKSPPQSIHATQTPTGPNVARVDMAPSQIMYTPVPPPRRVPGSDVKVRTPRLGAPESPIPPIGTKVPSPPTSPLADKEPLEPSAPPAEELDPEVLMLQKWADGTDVDDAVPERGANDLPPGAVGMVAEVQEKSSYVAYDEAELGEEEEEAQPLHRRCTDEEEPEVDEELAAYHAQHGIPADELLLETDLLEENNEQEKSEGVEFVGKEPVALEMQEMLEVEGVVMRTKLEPEQLCKLAMHEEVAEIDEELVEYHEKVQDQDKNVQDQTDDADVNVVDAAVTEEKCEFDTTEVQALLERLEGPAGESETVEEDADEVEESIIIPEEATLLIGERSVEEVYAEQEGYAPATVEQTTGDGAETEPEEAIPEGENAVEDKSSEVTESPIVPEEAQMLGIRSKITDEPESVDGSTVEAPGVEREEENAEDESTQEEGDVKVPIEDAVEKETAPAEEDTKDAVVEESTELKEVEKANDAEAEVVVPEEETTDVSEQHAADDVEDDAVEVETATEEAPDAEVESQVDETGEVLDNAVAASEGEAPVDDGANEVSQEELKEAGDDAAEDEAVAGVTVPEESADIPATEVEASGDDVVEAVLEQKEATVGEVQETVENQEEETAPEDKPDEIPSENTEEEDKEESNDAALIEEQVLAEKTPEEAADAEPVEIGQAEVASDSEEKLEESETIDDADPEADGTATAEEAVTGEAEEQAEVPGEDTVDSHEAVPDRLTTQEEGEAVAVGVSDWEIGGKDVLDSGKVITEGDAGSRRSRQSSAGKEVEALLARQDSEGSLAKTETDITIEMDNDSMSGTDSRASTKKADDDEEEEKEETVEEAEENDDDAKDDDADDGGADDCDGERDAGNTGDADDTGNADDSGDAGDADDVNQGNEDQNGDDNGADNDDENEDAENDDEEVQESGGEEACQGSNCGTPEPASDGGESSQSPCVDGHGCGTPEPTEEAETAPVTGPQCIDGQGCGTPEPTEEAGVAPLTKSQCVDGHGCGTPEPRDESDVQANQDHDCVDGNGCGTPEPVQEALADSSQVPCDNDEDLRITLPEDQSPKPEASGENVVPRKPKGPKIQRPYSGKGMSSAMNWEEEKRYKKYQSCRLAYSGNPEDEEERQGRDSSPERSLSKANVHKRVKKGRPKSAFAGSVGKSAPDSSLLRIGNKVVLNTDAEKKRILRRPRSAAGPVFSSSKVSKEKEELIQLMIGKLTGDVEVRKSRPMSVSGRPISASVSASKDRPAWGGRPQSGTRQLLVLAPKMKDINSVPKKKLKFKVRGEKMESASGVSLNTLACSYCGSKGRRIMDYAGDTGFCICSICYKKMNEQADDNGDERVGNPTGETNANLDSFFESLDENDAQVIEEEVQVVADAQDAIEDAQEPANNSSDDVEVAEILEMCIETEEADEEVNRICSAREDNREQPKNEITRLEANILESGRSAKVCVMCGLEDSCCVCGPDTKFVPDSSLLDKISYSKLENVRDGIKQSRIAAELKRLEDLYGVYSDDSETDGEDEEIGGVQVPVESSSSDPDERDELQAYKEQCGSTNLGKMSGSLTVEKSAKKPPRIRPGSAQRRSSIQNGKVILLEHTISHDGSQAGDLSQEADNLVAMIEKGSKEVEAKRVAVEEIEAVAHQLAMEAKAIKDDYEAVRASAMPALNSATTALGDLRKNDIDEIKSMCNPPQSVKLLIESICIMMQLKPVRRVGDDSKAYDYWSEAKKMLSCPNFLDRLVQFNKDKIPQGVMKKIRTRYLTNPGLNPEKIKQVSLACEGLCKWVIGIATYDEVNQTVARKREGLANAEAALAEKMAMLEEKRAELKELSAKLNVLKRNLNIQRNGGKGNSVPVANQQMEEEEDAKLEVVATAKAISKPRNEPDGSAPVAPYPPLCFKINARPPQGYLYYFAYGTDMNAERLQIYLSREMTDRFWGLLYGFKLVFNKRGSDVEAGGFANIEFNPYSSVEGCLYLITPAELAILDKYVGYPEHYEHAMFPTWLLNCTEPDLYGVAQYCVPALTYIAQDKWTRKPTDPALSTENNIKECLKNADLLTPAYKHNLSGQLEAAQEQTVLQ